MKRKLKLCKSCNKERYLFGKGMCTSCYNLVNIKPITRIKTLNKISSHQKERNKKYSCLRENFLISFPICQCCKIKPSTEIHHKCGRDGNNLFTDFLATCRPCHIWIEENPQEAKEKGLSISRLN